MISLDLEARAFRAVRAPSTEVTGGGEHTPGEWTDTSQLATGRRCAGATITGWKRGAREGGGA